VRGHQCDVTSRCCHNVTHLHVVPRLLVSKDGLHEISV
jgi:hypothetical protein